MTGDIYDTHMRRSRDFFIYPEKSLIDSCDEYDSDYEDDYEDDDEHTGKDASKTKSFEQRLDNLYDDMGQAFQKSTVGKVFHDAVDTLSTASCDMTVDKNAKCFDPGTPRFDHKRGDSFMFTEDEDCWEVASYPSSTGEGSDEYSSVLTSFDDQGKSQVSSSEILSGNSQLDRFQGNKMIFKDFLKNAREDMKKIKPTHSSTDAELTSSMSDYTVPKASTNEENEMDTEAVLRPENEMDGGFLLRTRSSPAPSTLTVPKLPIKRTKSYDSADLAKIAIAMNRQMLKEVSLPSSGSQTGMSNFRRAQHQYQAFSIDLQKTLSGIVEEDEVPDIDSIESEEMKSSNTKHKLFSAQQPSQSNRFATLMSPRIASAFSKNRTQQNSEETSSSSSDNANAPVAYLRKKMAIKNFLKKQFIVETPQLIASNLSHDLTIVQTSCQKSFPGFLSKGQRRLFPLKSNRACKKMSSEYKNLNNKSGSTMSTCDDSFEGHPENDGLDYRDNNHSKSFEDLVILNQGTGFEVTDEECIVFDQQTIGFEVTASRNKLLSHRGNEEELLSDEIQRSGPKRNTPKCRSPNLRNQSVLQDSKRLCSFVASDTFEVELSGSMDTTQPERTTETEDALASLKCKSVKDYRQQEGSSNCEEKDIPVKNHVFLKINKRSKSSTLSENRKIGRSWKNIVWDKTNELFYRRKPSPRESRTFAYQGNKEDKSCKDGRAPSFHSKGKVGPLPKQVGTECSEEKRDIGTMDTENPSLSFAFSDSLKKLWVVQVMAAINAELHVMNKRERSKNAAY